MKNLFRALGYVLLVVFMVFGILAFAWLAPWELWVATIVISALLVIVVQVKGHLDEKGSRGLNIMTSLPNMEEFLRGVDMDGLRTMDPEAALNMLDETFKSLPPDERIKFVVGLHSMVLSGLQERLQNLEHALAVHLFGTQYQSDMVATQKQPQESPVDEEDTPSTTGAYL